MTYDADGLRSKRTDGSNTYLYYYDGGLLRCMEYNGVKIFFTYDAQGMPVSMTYNGATYYYALNLQGDVMAILNASSAAVVNYNYNAWGELLSTTGSLANTTGLYNPLRYRGYVYDRETGLYYLQSRYYNPEICRFINADKFLSTGQSVLGHNVFAYCGNNPVSREDSSGDAFDTVWDIISVGVDIIELAANPTNLVTWGALAADVASLILPGVTGGGKIVRFVASADDIIDAAKYADDVVDASKAISSSLDLGKKMHKLYNPVAESATGHLNKTIGKVFESSTSRLRPDAVDISQKIIYELKPYNKKSFQQAVRQTQKYIDAIPNGRKYTVIIDMYF